MRRGSGYICEVAAPVDEVFAKRGCVCDHGQEGEGRECASERCHVDVDDTLARSDR